MQKTITIICIQEYPLSGKEIYQGWNSVDYWQRNYGTIKYGWFIPRSIRLAEDHKGYGNGKDFSNIC